MTIAGTAADWAEAISDAMDDPELRPAGSAEPHYAVSQEVSVSRDHGFYVYHLTDDQLGPGSSLGNAKTWTETKGSGNMLSLFSMDVGTSVAGGMSLTYLLPFMSISELDTKQDGESRRERSAFAQATTSAVGKIHLHPAYQQHESVMGDGLHVLETFFVPRTGMDDPALAVQTAAIWNRAPHPVHLTVVASLDARGKTPMDIAAKYSKSHHALVIWNQSHPEWVRVFGASEKPTAYWATTDEEEAHSPRKPLPCLTSETGTLVCSLQFDLLLLPGQHHKLRLGVSFSPSGKSEALSSYGMGLDEGLLPHTIAHYADQVNKSIVETPDEMITHALQWSKTCLVRPLARYPVGEAFTNDPGHSSSLVGRDMAWYVQGCDFIEPSTSCSMLDILARGQRDDGLIPEYVDGLTGDAEDFGFNINDNTPLFLIALAHHAKTAGHWDCLRRLYASAKRAGDRILASIDGNGLVRCEADGIGSKGICGWRNVLKNEQITGEVTEVNSECYAALRSLADLAEMSGESHESIHYRDEALRLRNAINERLLDARNGLYVRNIDLQGRVFTQASVDMVFPLICGVADEMITRSVVARLAQQDFMTEAGIRVLPTGNPHYDPSFESGCLGGVWPGATWWYGMSAADTEPGLLAESLRRAYYHFVSDPRTYNTVPGQFSEWSDGQTLVNRGMRLSPWDSPRFIWAAIEGLAGVTLQVNDVLLRPHLPPEWLWLRTQRIPYRDGLLSFFIAKQEDGMHVYSPNSFETDLNQHHYERDISDGLETVTTGISASAFERGDEVIICLGNNQERTIVGPLLARQILCANAVYDVSHLGSHQQEWTDSVVIKGEDLMRIAVPVQSRGFALYRFRRPP